MSTPAVPAPPPAAAAPPVNATKPIILPKRGTARVKSVLSGDTVVLWGKPVSNGPPPEVLFTFESMSAPRLASKSTPVDEPEAFPAREWLRKLVVGKAVNFETRKQGGAAGDRVYGWLFLPDAAAAGNAESPGLHLNVECVRQGYATPKAIKYPSKDSSSSTGDKDAAAASNDTPELTEEQAYEDLLLKAYQEATNAGRGLHATKTTPLVRKVTQSGEDFTAHALVEACQKLAPHSRLTVVVEHVFDGSRLKCQVVDDSVEQYQYASFTLLLAGITSPRMANTRADPPTPQEAFADEARQFVLSRLLQRELPVSLIGTDKSGSAAVGTVHHPRGNIAVELLKHGLARTTDWSIRLLAPAEVPALRVAENQAKRAFTGIWHSYAPPVLQSASTMRGQVVEVQSGDTVLMLPEGKAYSSEEVLVKVSLASIRAPRVGNERAGRPDEPYAWEAKDKLRHVCIGKVVTCVVHYERDIPIRPEVLEKRPFCTLSVGKMEDVSEVLIKEGLVVTQRHRDDDPKSPRYDELRAAESEAKELKKGVHKEGDYKRGAINDLTEPRKAKAYSGALMRAGNTKAIVDHCFNGGLFKLYVPKENCYVRFAPSFVRCPQPSPSPGSTSAKAAEPFGDDAKRHARLSLMQRPIEISCNGVTNSGVLTGSLFVGTGPQRRDYAIELLGSGFATVDQRKIDYGEAPRHLIEAMNVAKESKVGLWSLAQPEAAPTTKPTEKSKDVLSTVQLSEIRSGTHFFFHVVGDDASKVMDDSMKVFTKNNGTNGAPCDVKIGKVVAALFDDGSGKSWYRAKIVERVPPGKASVLFVDHGNIATVPIATHLRPLDMSLGTDRIPPVAHEATLALTVTRPLSTDEGVDAARMLQSTCWGRDLQCRRFGPDAESGKLAVALYADGTTTETVNAQLVSEGLARMANKTAVEALASRMVDATHVKQLALDLEASQTAARKTRSGMWRYGDVGDEDPDDL